MCGITGFLSTSATISLTQTHLQQLTNTLRHRGPDAEGYYFEQPTNTSAQKISIGLGHRRLSIIDLRRQPTFLYHRPTLRFGV